MRTLLTLLLLAACSHVSATSCDPVSRTLTNAQRIAWAPVLAKQLSVSSVSVSQSFTLSGWHIVYVETPNADSPFLFFHGDPLSTHFVTLWAGAARMQEEGSIRAWVIKNASGIPAPLATCFAWYVTKARNQ
jgi:hypothetical protein